jgi:hypothetical protein
MKISNVFEGTIKIIASVEFWKILAPALIAIFAWSLNQSAKLEWEQYTRKEQSYKNLLESSRGFYSSTGDTQLRQKFLNELNQCWLYAPDEVIIKGYQFLETVHRGSGKTEQEQQNAMGEFVVAIRKDLLSREIVEETNLTPKDFKHLKVVHQK